MISWIKLLLEIALTLFMPWSEENNGSMKKPIAFSFFSLNSIVFIYSPMKLAQISRTSTFTCESCSSKGLLNDLSKIVKIIPVP